VTASSDPGQASSPAGPTGNRGTLLIVSSPSGAGKTTLTRRLLGEFSPAVAQPAIFSQAGTRPGGLVFSVSYTTRPQRPGEVEGRDYHFVTGDQFEAMVRRGEFAEHAVVFGNRYGTAQAPVEAALDRGTDVIFDVDWQGGANLAQRWKDDSLKVFILPPDLDVLAARLQGRATDAPEVIERRLRKAIEELNHFEEYQHLIVNDDLDRAYAVLRAIYLTRRYGTTDRPELPYRLGELARLVDSNRESGADAHARRLIGRR
jgi:guanylate kinase